MADENKPAFYPRVGNITPKRRAPLAQTEVREQPLDPIMRTFKDLMDRSSALLDKSKVSPFDVTKGLISAIPFEGERFAKDFEQSTMPIPTGFGLLPKATPQGIDTSEMGMQSVRVPTKEALNELKWSDLVGTAGASRMFEALGQNRTPEFFDTLDATMLVRVLRLLAWADSRWLTAACLGKALSATSSPNTSLLLSPRVATG